MMDVIDENQQIDYLEEDYMKSGNKRSLIRRIASTLPLSSTQRPRFELLPNGARLIDGSQQSVFSLSDISQLIDLPNRFAESQSCTDTSTGFLSEVKDDMSPGDSDTSGEKVVHKISALEDELSLLRSKIAMLVSNQNKQQEDSTNASLTFGCFLNGSNESFACSTPIKSESLPSSASSPPQHTSPTDTHTSSDVKSIKERKPNQVEDLEPEVKSPMLMIDVLKDLHKVKLKSISKSPRSAYMKTKKSAKYSDPSDPATFIALALRKKFAQRNKCISESSDNSQDSDFSLGTSDKERENSPPKFGQNVLKKNLNVPAS